MSDLVKLNLGCGTDIRPGFINIDIEEYPNVNKVQDVMLLSAFENESVDFIVAQHLLEYIPRECLLSALWEWRRILKPKASLEIRVTDLSTLTKSIYLYDVSQEMGMSHEMVISLLYGKQKNRYDIRLNGFTSDFLQGVLVGLGYEVNNVVREGHDVIITVIRNG